MSTKPDLFAGSIAHNYHRYFVPLIFDDYARDLAGGLKMALGAPRVLELACGTGALTRHLRRTMAGKGTLVATDLSPDMVETARANLNGEGAHDYRTADGTDLPFEDDSFDLVFCQFGVMFYADKSRGYAEAARVLRPGGAFRFNVWDSLRHNRLCGLAHETMVAMFPDDPPTFMETPFGYADIDTIVSDLQRAGFRRVDVAVRPRESRAPSAAEVVRGVILGSPLGSQLSGMGVLEEACDGFERALTAEFGTGEIRAPMQAIEFSARRG